MAWIRTCVALALLGAFTALGCSKQEGAEVSHKDAWGLVVTYKGAELRLPLERMDIYLVEDEESYPEIFEIVGPNVALVGEFPMNIHVGYDNNWNVLFGQSIAISRHGGDPREEKESFIEVPGDARMRILDGTLVPESMSGTYAGIEGDQTLSGTITLRVATELGEETITGRFAVLCVTWG